MVIRYRVEFILTVYLIIRIKALPFTLVRAFEFELAVSGEDIIG